MNVSEAVASRVTIRAFLPKPVPGELVRDILVRAAQAPSGGNLQPWRVYALAGQPLADF
jgi:nitroreductase